MEGEHSRDSPRRACGATLGSTLFHWSRLESVTDGSTQFPSQRGNYTEEERYIDLDLSFAYCSNEEFYSPSGDS